MSIFTKWLQQKHDQKILKTIDPFIIVKEINSKEKEISKLTDEELKNKTKEFPKRRKTKRFCILAEVFATLRES